MKIEKGKVFTFLILSLILFTGLFLNNSNVCANQLENQHFPADQRITVDVTLTPVSISEQEIPEISDPLYQVIPDLPFLPPFIQSVIEFAWVALVHILVTFGFITALAFLLSALSESYWAERFRKRLLARPDNGMETIWLAVQLGFFSIPNRRRIFAQAKELLINGVSKAGVLAYLFSAQSILVFMLLFIIELNGPQPAIGLIIAVATGVLLLSQAVKLLPDELWDKAREHSGETFYENNEKSLVFTGTTGSFWRRIWKSLKGQFHSVWAPVLYGCLGIGFFLALGYTEAAFSLQESRGVTSQLLNTGAGLFFSFSLAAPLIGNALFAAGLWKGLYITYAGLMAFYLGTMVMPFTIHRYLDLFGYEVGRKVIKWLVTAIIAGALAATAWWWGLDRLAELLGIREWIESVIHSTLRPNDVPWFHRWFAPGL